MRNELPNSKDYHDYVIKEGRLVGQFESMYQHADSVPWRQDEQDGWLDVRLELELLREYAPFTQIHDFGCGLGYFLNVLGKSLGRSDCVLSGSDISPTACTSASALFPCASFSVVDLMSSPPMPKGSVHSGDCGTSLFSLRGTLWYVFPKLENVVANIASAMRKTDLLLVAQNFPPLHQSFVGKDVIPNPQSLVDSFSYKFHCKRSLWLENKESSGNDNWFVGLFEMRETQP